MMFLGIFVYGFFLYLGEGLLTLVSQYNGMDDARKANQTLNKALVINLILFVPICLGLVYMEALLIFLKISSPEA